MGPDRRATTLDTITSDVLAMVDPRTVLRVGVDGVDGAGKSVFADELAGSLARHGVAVLRASVDAFHHPAEVRYRRGRHSPEGFFRDSYDYGRLRRELLDPLGPGGDRQVVRAIHDVRDDRAIQARVESAEDVDVLVFDGVFLHRPELRDCWDYSVFLDVDFGVSIPRGARRGYGHPDPEAEANRRYIGGQRLYLRECQPQRHASVVVDNNDLAEAVIVQRAPHGPGREVAAPEVGGTAEPLPAGVARVVLQLVDLLPPAEVNWALTGSVAHRLSGVAVPLGGDIDVQADEAGAFEIQRRLPADAIVEEVWWRDSGLIRSYFGRADLDGVPVDIMGALQKRLSQSEPWTPPVDPADHRQYVEFGGVAVPVMGLAHEAWAYDMLGRPERAALLRRAAAHSTTTGGEQGA